MQVVHRGVLLTEALKQPRLVEFSGQLLKNRSFAESSTARLDEDRWFGSAVYSSVLVDVLVEEMIFRVGKGDFFHANATVDLIGSRFRLISALFGLEVTATGGVIRAEAEKILWYLDCREHEVLHAAQASMEVPEFPSEGWLLAFEYYEFVELHRLRHTAPAEFFFFKILTEETIYPAVGPDAPPSFKYWCGSTRKEVRSEKLFNRLSDQEKEEICEVLPHFKQ